MVHVTRSRRPEVVLFGKDQRFLTPLAVNAGNQILVTSPASDEIAVSKFAANEPDQKRIVSTRVDDVIRAIVELGGTYPDVVQALQEAKAAGPWPAASRSMPCRRPAASTTGSAEADRAGRRVQGRDNRRSDSPTARPVRSHEMGCQDSTTTGDGDSSRARPGVRGKPASQSRRETTSEKGFFARISARRRMMRSDLPVPAATLLPTAAGHIRRSAHAH